MIARFPGVASIMRNSGWLVGGHALTVLARLLYAAILARALAPDMYGSFTYAMAWYLSFIAFTYLGLDVALSRSLAGNRKDAPALLGATLGLRMGAAIAAAALSIAVAFIAEPDLLTRKLIVILSLALLARTLWLWCLSVFTALETARKGAALDAVFRPLELGALLALLHFNGPDLVGIAMLHALSWWGQALAGYFWIARSERVKVSGFGSRALPLIRAGVPAAIYTLAVIWVLQLPIIFYRHIAGAGDMLGQVALALQLVGYLQVIPYLAASAALPVLSRSAIRVDGKDLGAARAVLVAVPAASALIALGSGWLASFAVPLLFGASFTPAAEVFGEAVWLLVPLALAIALQQFVFSRDVRSPIATFAPLAGILLGTLASLPLIASFGYRGALLGTAAGTLLWSFGTFVALVESGLFSRSGQSPAKREGAPATP